MKLRRLNILRLIGFALTCATPCQADDKKSEHVAKFVIRHESKLIDFPAKEIEKLRTQCRSIIEERYGVKAANAKVKLDSKSSIQDVMDFIVHKNPKLSLRTEGNPNNKLGIDSGQTALTWLSPECERAEIFARICFMLELKPMWDGKLKVIALVRKN